MKCQLVKCVPSIYEALGLNQEFTSLLNPKLFEIEEYNVSSLEKPLFLRENNPQQAKEELIESMSIELTKEA